MVISQYSLLYSSSLCTVSMCFYCIFSQVQWNGKTTDDLPKTAMATLQACRKELYPNIHTLLRIVCTLPVTSCECERSFSSLRRLKTFSRSTMGEGRLNSLALMYIHRALARQCSIDELVSTFARKKPRKIMF